MFPSASKYVTKQKVEKCFITLLYVCQFKANHALIQIQSKEQVQCFIFYFRVHLDGHASNAWTRVDAFKRCIVLGHAWTLLHYT